MQFQQVVADRRTIRHFQKEPIEKATITEILETATRACNSGNEQLWRFIVIQNEIMKQTIGKVLRGKTNQILNEAKKITKENITYIPRTFFLDAPVIIAVVDRGVHHTPMDNVMIQMGYDTADVHELRCRGDLQTVGAATQLLLLAAWEKGLGGCWMTGPLYARKELENVLDIQQNEILTALVPIGKPDGMPKCTARKPIEDIVTFLE